MPELPEVEVVRRGLDSWVVGRQVGTVEVFHPRAVRRHLAGDADFASKIAGRTVLAAHRRGKYLWLPLDSGGEVIVGHLGMSGQLLVQLAEAPDERNLRIRFRFADQGRQLRFVDQRTFGGLSVDLLVGDLPSSLVHIARDPLDPEFDPGFVLRCLRARRTGIKRALLDQTLVSGIGNIYADEALWRAGVHYARPTETLPAAIGRELLDQVQAVMIEALAQGGTSFDSLYIDVNGRSGYFARSLDAYGRETQPCRRCGTPICREPFMNRSSFRCPRCQPRPRRGRW
jgi:formamidopyrimidine-DNA glycosylase